MDMFLFSKRVTKGVFIILLFIPNIVSAQTTLRDFEAEKDTLYRYFDNIIQKTFPIEKEIEIAMQFRYIVPASKTNKLAYFIKERERRKACYDYIYKRAIKKRVLCKMEIDSVYRDSINSILIPVRGNRISGDNISLVLQLSPIIKLDKDQFRYLLDKAIAMARSLSVDPRKNIWNEEMDLIRNVLSSEQLDCFFRNKNAESLTKEIDEGWRKIVNAGYREEIDSVTEFPKAYAYYSERRKIKDLFRYHSSSQRKHLAELDKQKPLFVKMIESIDRAEREMNRNREKNVGKEFVW